MQKGQVGRGSSSPPATGAATSVLATGGSENITKSHRAKVAELKAIEHFRKKPSGSNNKNDTINVGGGGSSEANDSGGDNVTKMFK